jgi:hypothetical protein
MNLKFVGKILPSCAVVLNVLGVIAYILIASTCWIEPELANEPGAGGGAPIVWGLLAHPIPIIFFALNSLCLLAALIVYRKKWVTIVSFLCVQVTWAVAIHIDFSHH